jgi:hypothetical protein
MDFKAKEVAKYCDLFFDSLNRLFHRFFYNSSKSFRLTNSQISQHLAIEVNLSLFQTMDQPAVGCAVHASGSIDPGNPQLTKVSFAIPAIAISIPLAFQVLLVRTAVQLALGPVVTFIELQDLLVPLVAMRPTFYTCHVTLLCEPLGVSDVLQSPVANTQQPQPNKINSTKLFILVHIGRKATNFLANVSGLDRDHTFKQALCAVWCSAAQVAFADFCAHDDSGT